MRGDRPMGLGDATTALEEMAELDELESLLDQDYAGAIARRRRPRAGRTALGRRRVDDVRGAASHRTRAGAAGLPVRQEGRLELVPARRTAARRRPRCGGSSPSSPRPGRGESRRRRCGCGRRADRCRAGSGSSATSSRWTSSAPSRNARARRAGEPGRGGVKLAVDGLRGDRDRAAYQRRRRAAGRPVVLDGAARGVGRGEVDRAGVAQPGHDPVPPGRDRGDRLQPTTPAQLPPTELAGMSWDMVQGTNLQHALMLAGGSSPSTRTAEPVVLVVTDGEPTAHLHPRRRRVVRLAAAARDAGAHPRRGRTLPPVAARRSTSSCSTTNRGLVDFVDAMVERNGGRVFSPSPDRLGEYVVRDYLRARRGRRRR